MDWPRCACGDFALDGKVNCGRVECKLPQAIENSFYAPPADDETLVVYAIYEKPKDFPEDYVARRLEVRAGVASSTPFYAKATTLGAARGAIPAGKVRIVETNVDPWAALLALLGVGVVEAWI